MQLAGRRILMVKPSSLGDIVHALPVAHALKRCCPGCFIGWIVQQSFAPLLEADPCIDKIHSMQIPSTSEPQAGRRAWLDAFAATVGTLRRLRSQLQKEPYDLILDLHASLRSGMLGRTNPGGVRIGFGDARELNTFFQDQLVEVSWDVRHALAKNLLFCSHLGMEASEEDFFLPCRDEDRQLAMAFLREHGMAGKQAIYANPAARWQSKFWPAEHWAELADRFHEQGGMAMVFGGSRQDVGYIESIVRLMKTRPAVAAGRMGLSQTAALIGLSSLYVGLDSGPMHMAALARVPVVALFGPTHPDRVGPFGTAHRIVRAEGIGCLECRRRTCSRLDCMKGISVQMVHDAAVQLLHPHISVHP